MPAGEIGSIIISVGFPSFIGWLVWMDSRQKAGQDKRE